MYLQNLASQDYWNSIPVEGITPDFVSSAAKRMDLSLPVRVQETAQPRSGDLVLACVQEVNPVYPNLELADGTEHPLNRGNLIIGSLGTRKALHGFSGHVPPQLKVGQEISLLNKGGVMGDCTAFHRNLEWPTRLTYLGTLQTNGKPVNLKDHALPLVEGPLPDVPLVLVLGTCMNAGKTTACKTIVSNFASRGAVVHGGKVAGVACQQDLIALKKAGARKVHSFHDFGYPSSADVESLVPVARSIFHYLASPRPDFTILEMGDGILGGYHVSSVFSDQEFLSRQICTIICANDLMGAWGALDWMKQNEFPFEESSVLISGPVTDSGEGVRYIEQNWRVTAANPFDSPGKLASFVQKRLSQCSK